MCAKLDLNNEKLMEFAAQIRTTKHRNVNVIDVVREGKEGRHILLCKCRESHINNKHRANENRYRRKPPAS